MPAEHSSISDSRYNYAVVIRCMQSYRPLINALSNVKICKYMVRCTVSTPKFTIYYCPLWPVQLHFGLKTDIQWHLCTSTDLTHVAIKC